MTTPSQNTNLDDIFGQFLHTVSRFTNALGELASVPKEVSDSDRGRTSLDVVDPGNCAGYDAHSHRKGRKKTS
jgi:hypothetical protein